MLQEMPFLFPFSGISLVDWVCLFFRLLTRPSCRARLSRFPFFFFSLRLGGDQMPSLGCGGEAGCPSMSIHSAVCCPARCDFGGNLPRQSLSHVQSTQPRVLWSGGYAMVGHGTASAAFPLRSGGPGVPGLGLAPAPALRYPKLRQGAVAV